MLKNTSDTHIENFLSGFITSSILQSTLYITLVYDLRAPSYSTLSLEPILFSRLFHFSPSRHPLLIFMHLSTSPFSLPLQQKHTQPLNSPTLQQHSFLPCFFHHFTSTLSHKKIPLPFLLNKRVDVAAKVVVPLLTYVGSRVEAVEYEPAISLFRHKSNISVIVQLYLFSCFHSPLLVYFHFFHFSIPILSQKVCNIAMAIIIISHYAVTSSIA